MSKRANGEGTISQRSSDKRWIGQITIPNPGGKQIKKTVSAKTQAECKKKLDDLKKQLSVNPYVAPKKISYTDYLKLWLEQKENLEKLKPTTILTHKDRIRLYIEPYFKNIDIQKITTYMLNNFYTTLTGKISAHTVRKVHNIINNSFKFAVRDGIISSNPAEKALLPKFTVKKQSALSSDEIEKLLLVAKEYQEKPTTKTKNVYPFISLAIASGCRRGELAALEWQNVDLDNNLIRINQSVMDINGHNLIGAPKTESSIRDICISPDVMEILKNHRHWAVGRFVFPGVNNPNKVMPLSSIERFFYTVIEKAQLECGLHKLRHSHMTHLAENGVNIKTIQERAGHSQLSTTMGYVHPSKAKDMEAASVFDKFFHVSADPKRPLADGVARP